MSKKASSHLHELIKSLTKSEKRYFKIYSSRHTIGEENNYIQLFDYIEQQEEYNEEILFQHFKGAAFLNKFSITKNRLYESVIKALDAYHANNSLEAQLYKQLHASTILYDKGLYKQSLKLLLSAKKLAEKNEKTIILLEINEKLKKLNESCGEKCFDKEAITKIFKRDSEYSETLIYYNQLWRIKGELFAVINNTGKARSEEAKSRYEQIFFQLKELKPAKNKTFEVHYLENHIFSAYHFSVLQEVESLKYLKNNIALFQASPKKIKHDSNKYFSILSNIIHIESSLNNFKSAIDYLNELKAFPEKYKIHITTDLEIKLFSIVKSTELMLYIKRSEFNKAANLEDQIINGLERFEGSISPNRRAYLYFQLSVAFFGEGNFSKSLKWINKIFNDCEIDDKVDIVSFAHMFNLIIHLEMENYRLLPYSLQRAKRFLKKRNSAFKFEGLFMLYINKILKIESKFDEERILEAILEEITELKTDPYENVALEYFDFESWIVARIKCKTFATVHRDTYLSAIQF